jgi:hypothetical protein
MTAKQVLASRDRPRLFQVGSIRTPGDLHTQVDKAPGTLCPQYRTLSAVIIHFMGCCKSVLGGAMILALV